MEFDPAVAPSNAAEFTKVTEAKSFAGLHRVAIAQFQVEYVTKSLGLTRKERNQTTVEYRIETPLPDSSLQAETDKLYAAFVARLTAAGYEVVPNTAVTTAVAWASLVGIAKPSPAESHTESGGGRLTNAFNMPTYSAPGDIHMGTGFSAMGSAFSMSTVKESVLATELGAAVLNVRLVVGFKETDKHTDLFAIARSGSSFVGHPRLVVQALASGMSVTLPGKPTAGRIALASDLMFREDVLAENMAMNTSGGQQAGNVLAKAAFASRILGGFIPGGGMLGAMKLNTAYRVACGPSETNYMAAVDSNLSGATAVLVNQLSAIR